MLHGYANIGILELFSVEPLGKDTDGIETTWLIRRLPIGNQSNSNFVQLELWQESQL